MADTTYKIVETDNFDSDWPAERFVEPLPPLKSREHAEAIVAVLLLGLPEMYPRFWKVVKDDYRLRPGFEP